VQTIFGDKDGVRHKRDWFAQRRRQCAEDELQSQQRQGVCECQRPAERATMCDSVEKFLANKGASRSFLRVGYPTSRHF